MIADILPAGAVAAESFGPPGDQELFPAEAAAIATADPVRRSEFAAGRAVARAALARLGVPAGPILPGRAGEPQWPGGVVGSITHCAGYRACAVAPARDMAAIGIDAEPCLALADGLLAAMAGDAERAWLAELSAANPGTPWDRVLFSAKESLYKAWYPHTGERPGLRSITVRIFPAGTLAAATRSGSAVRCGTAAPATGHPGGSAAGPPAALLTGRWLVNSGLIVTAVSMPA
jgi:enterobactin synthetase component D / holo-[acyl-carrier protein] synthase